MGCWTAETERILAAHQADFNSFNWEAKLRHYGGYYDYLDILGGVFAKWNGKNADVKTAAQFREIAEYVFGLMALYGFNYNNGETHVRWGGPSPFYPSKDDGVCNWGEIDTLCSSRDKSKTTNCNYGIDSLYRKAGLSPRLFDKSERYKWQARTFPVILKKKDLRIGDLVHFFHGRVTSEDPDTWKDWGHVACVGEIRGNTVILYDSGNRFIKTGNYKKEFTVDTRQKPTGLYDNYDGWAGIRVVELAGNNGESKGTSDWAVEVIAGKWGSGAERQRRLAERYDDVQTRVNYFLGGTPRGTEAYLRAAAGYVLKGFAGSGDEREKFFGARYPAVQLKVNWVIQTAKDVIAGKYGNDEARREALGIDYSLVQAQVNRMV